MRTKVISRIRFEMEPSLTIRGNKELSCRMFVDGEWIGWREYFLEEDFTSNFERYFDYMKHKILYLLKNKYLENEKTEKAAE